MRRQSQRIQGESGAIITGLIIVGGITLGVAALFANNYFVHGNISVACTMMGLPLGSC